MNSPHQLEVCREKSSLLEVGILTPLVPTAAEYVTALWGLWGWTGRSTGNWSDSEMRAPVVSIPALFLPTFISGWIKQDFLGA